MKFVRILQKVKEKYETNIMHINNTEQQMTLQCLKIIGYNTVICKIIRMIGENVYNNSLL